MNTTNATIENKQTMTNEKGNWMTAIAGLLFGITVFLQIMMLIHDVRIDGFADFAYYNVLPLTVVLAYFGMRREQRVLDNCNDASYSVPESNC